MLQAGDTPAFPRARGMGSRGTSAMSALPHIPAGHHQAPPKPGTPGLGQAFPAEEAWSYTGGSCPPNPPLGKA